MIDAGERYVELDQIAALVHVLLAMTLSYVDRSVEGASKILPYKREADLKLIVDALRKAGLKSEEAERHVLRSVFTVRK